LAFAALHHAGPRVALPDPVMKVLADTILDFDELDVVTVFSHERPK
jgi:hypothetical protein